MQFEEELYPYQVDQPFAVLDDNEQRTLLAAKMLVDYQLSLRRLSREVGVSKSKLHRDFKRLYLYCDELACAVKAQYRRNKRR